MKNMTKHPLRITADALKTAFLLEGFQLYDNGEYPELERAEVNVKIFENPGAVKKPVLLEEGQYALRTQLLPFALPAMGRDGRLPAAVSGKVFDGSCAVHPAHLLIEGVLPGTLSLYDIGVLWKKIARRAFGAACDAETVKCSGRRAGSDLASWGSSAMTDNTLAEPDTWEIRVSGPEEKSFVLGYFGTMTWLGSALLGAAGAGNCFAFSIDVDSAAVWSLGLADREALFNNTQEFLGGFADGSVSATEAFEDRCRDVLRALGYTEGYGPKIYPDGIYKKMNMIQDEWDLNNKGVQLAEPLGDQTGLPTVLTPAIEQILSEKWAAGETCARAFEISHIFMPQKDGAPIEKLALSFGAYGEDMDLGTFKEEVGDFLTKIGNKNHFYVPTGLAIAYNTKECLLLLDEKMSYLGGNFGGISEKAERNFGIGTHAYMANLELLPLKNKADEEYGYIAPELR